MPDVNLVDKIGLTIVRGLHGEDSDQFYTPEELGHFRAIAREILLVVADDLGDDFLASGDWLRGQAAKAPILGASQGQQGGPASDESNQV